MKRALLVIDVQNEYFTGRLPVSFPADSLANILDAVDCAAGHGVPVILIRHTSPAPGAKTFVRGTPGWDVHPEIMKRPHDCLIEKGLPGSFTGTELEQRLREGGVDTVAICGYMSQMCCDTTARQAMHMGFGVEFLSDATGTLAITNSAGSISAEELHRAVLVTQAMRFSTVLSTPEWKSLVSGTCGGNEKLKP